MSIEASLPMLLAIFGVSCSVVLAGRTDSVKLIVAGGMIMLATASALVAITVATSI